MTDVDVDDVGEGVVVHVPNVLHDHRAAERTPTVPHHVFEDAELLRRKVDRFTCTGNAAPDGIEYQVANLEFFRGWLSAPKQYADPGQQLRESERLHKIVVS